MDIKRNWHLFDAQDSANLGRLATQIAELLMGKHKTGFVRNADNGDYVVVINADKVKVSGQKERKKIYQTYSGFAGGLKDIPLFRMRDQKPEDIIYRAVRGMLPKNKLQDKMLRRMKLVIGSENPYSDKIKQ